MSENRENISSGGAFESVFGYSRAVRVGNHLHISGTCAPPANEHDDAYVQTQAILKTISQVIAQAYKEVFDSIRPASTIVQVDSMLRTWQRVEIEAYAISH